MSTPEKKRRTPAKINPNGANQWLADPRQMLFASYFFDPKSETFGNATASGLKAGFEKTYSQNLLNQMPAWLLRKVEDYRSTQMLEKAERNLDEILDLPNQVQAMGAFGPIFETVGGKLNEKGKMVGGKKVPVMTYATGLLKIKNDASQFVAERIGKKRYGADAPAVAPSITNIAIINLVPIKQ